jgi:hydrogenase/urease accessory protein HupE
LKRARLLLVLVVLAALARPSAAHETRPALLELRQLDAERYDVTWKVPAVGDLRLALDPVYPADCSIEGADGAVDAASTRRRAGEAWVERYELARQGGLEGQRVLVAGLRATLTDVHVRVLRLDGKVQSVRLSPAAPSFVVAATPSQLDAARSFLAVGVEHILLGPDHLLFVLGLLLIVRGRRALVGTISAFTLAHSLTLALATLGVARAPLAPLHAAIALSILFLGPEIVRRWRAETSLTLERPYLVAFAFGLLHGFGFASGLAELDLKGGELALGLLWFNVGVELGQLGFLAVLLALVAAFRALELVWPRFVARLPGYAVGVGGAYWTIERVAILARGAA